MLRLLFFATLLSPGFAWGQTGDSTAKPVELPAISLLGHPHGGSDLGSKALEKNATQLLHVTGAETMQRAADLTVTDAVQRMEGVSIIRGNAGEDSRVIIRGMSPKYNGVLVEGLVIPSPDDRNRDIPLDLFPSSLTQRVEVYKSLTPDMEASGIGGLVNIVMKDAGPSPSLTAHLATGYSTLFFNQTFTAFDRSVVQHLSPAQQHGPAYYATGADFTQSNLSFHSVHPLPDLLGGLEYSRRLSGGKLGLVLAGDFQHEYHGSDGFYIGTGAEPGLNNAPGLTDFYTRRYSILTSRGSLYNQWDYRFNAQSKITLFNFYTRQVDADMRQSVDTSLDEGRSGPGTGRIDILQRSRTHIQQLYSSLLTGAHRLDEKWALVWAGAYSFASGNYPDWAELDGETGRIQGSGNNIVQSPVTLGPLQRQWLSNKENQEELKAGISFTPKLSHGSLSLETGVDLRYKQRTNFYTEYNFVPALNGGMGQPFIDIYHAQWLNNNGPQNPLGSGANPNTYRAFEQIGAGYLAARFQAGRMDWVGGLRLETTLQDVTSTVDPTLSYGQHIRIHYADWLPSLQGRYSFANGNQLRLSYFEGISRPALSDVTFFSLTEEDFNLAGNPFLIRTTADNLDLRFAHYGNDDDSWQAGVFYKHLKDPFERTLLNAGDTLYPIPQNGLPYIQVGVLTEQLKNYPSATNYGVEAGYTKSWGKWGANIHYTFTVSQITQTAKWKTRTDPQNPSSDIVTISREETRPLEGQSMNLGGFSAWYKDPLRWTAQVSFTYVGARIGDVSGWYGLSQWQKGYALLDIAAERRTSRHLVLFGKVANALNAASITQIRQPDPNPVGTYLPGQSSTNRVTVQEMRNGARLMLGLRWNP